MRLVARACTLGAHQLGHPGDLLATGEPDAEYTVDLEEQVVHLPDDEDIPFTVDPFARQMLLSGTDEIGWVLSHRAAIDGWEAAHPARVDTRSEVPA